MHDLHVPNADPKGWLFTCLVQFSHFSLRFVTLTSDIVLALHLTDLSDTVRIGMSWALACLCGEPCCQAPPHPLFNLLPRKPYHKQHPKHWCSKMVGKAAVNTNTHPAIKNIRGYWWLYTQYLRNSKRQGSLRHVSCGGKHVWFLDDPTRKAAGTVTFSELNTFTVKTHLNFWWMQLGYHHRVSSFTLHSYTPRKSSFTFRLRA